MLKSGTICFNDMYFFAEVTAKAAADAGMRAVASMILVDFLTRFAGKPEEYLRKGLALHNRCRDHLLSGGQTPRRGDECRPGDRRDGQQQRPGYDG